MAGLFAFGLTVIAILLFLPLAPWFGLVDHPRGRKTHVIPTPLVGGLGIFAGVISSLIIFQVPIVAPIAYITAATLIVIIGMVDDRNDLSVSPRLWAQATAALIMALGGGLVIHDLGNWFGVKIELGYLAIPFTVFAVVGLINAFNMLDGLDGLAGMVAVSLLLVITYWARLTGAPEVGNLGGLLLAAVSAFLLFNLRLPWRRQAAVFMGDSGSMLLGFTFAWIAVTLLQDNHSDTAPIIVLWLVGFPVLDTIAIMLRRRSRKQSVFAPGQDHLHHICLRGGLTVNQCILLLSAITLILAGFGLIGALLHAPEELMIILLLLVGTLYYRVIDHAWYYAEKLRILFHKS